MNYDQVLALSNALAQLGGAIGANSPSASAAGSAISAMITNEQARRQREKEEEERKKAEKGAFGGSVGSTLGAIGGAMIPGVGPAVSAGLAGAGSAIGGYAGSKLAGGGAPSGMQTAQNAIGGAVRGYNMQGSPGFKNPRKYADPMDSMLEGYGEDFLPDLVSPQAQKQNRLMNILSYLENPGRADLGFTTGGRPNIVPSTGGAWSTIGLSPEQQAMMRNEWVNQARTEQAIQDSQIGNQIALAQNARAQDLHGEAMANAPLNREALLAAIGQTQAQTGETQARTAGLVQEVQNYMTPREKAQMDWEYLQKELDARFLNELDLNAQRAMLGLNADVYLRGVPQVNPPDEVARNEAQAAYVRQGGSSGKTEAELDLEAVKLAQRDVGALLNSTFGNKVTREEREALFKAAYKLYRGAIRAAHGAATPMDGGGEEIPIEQPAPPGMVKREFSMPAGTMRGIAEDSTWQELIDGSYIRIQ